MQGFEVFLAKDGNQGIELFHENRDVDICILDVMLPGKDGFTLAKEIKQADRNVPIIFLTARGVKEDVLEGYKSGAVDYLTKPFDSEVLTAKINAILTRQEIIEEDDDETVFEFTFGDYYFNSKIRELTYKSDPPEQLSPKENKLLRLLLVNKNDVVKREHALKKIWKEDNYFTSRSMDVYIAKVRKKIKRGDSVEIVNIHGEGFRLIQKK
ncbi:DNA-binding response regulator [Elysia marginata]|uniref:DNA-binding response regulator n=1 Tax=Elysia marginata TaxID=1093978 RepID=A0AAV4GKH8_9GAST|nr:DNA-binding response regulator [Elysia marginata]